MKTYEETIARLGQKAYALYMSGSNQIVPDGTGMVAFIYEKAEHDVTTDVIAVRDRLIATRNVIVYMIDHAPERRPQQLHRSP